MSEQKYKKKKSIFLELIFYQECLLLSDVQLFVTPWTVASQAALSMEFSRQEYWSW